MITNTCKIEGCTAACMPKRRYCHPHYLERKRALFNARRLAGLYHHTLYKCVCLWCNTSFMGYRKGTKFCSLSCHTAARSSMREKGTYKTSCSSGREAWSYRYLAIKAVGEAILRGYCLHHVDFNIDNESLSNLVLLRRADHAKLHTYITYTALMRVPYGTPLRVDEMRKLIPILTEEWFKKTHTKLVTVQQLVDNNASVVELA